MPEPLKPRASRNGRHFADLGERGANYVQTALVNEVIVKMNHVVQGSEIIVGFGPNGTGKSVAFTKAAARLADQYGLELISLQASALRQTHMVTEVVAGALGVEVERPAWRMAWRVQVALTQQRVLLHIDEGSYVSRETLGLLRDWHSDADAEWALAMSGNELFERRLLDSQPELLDRTERVVRTALLAEGESIAFAAGLHERFGETDEALLTQAHQDCTKGSLRRWAQLLKACLDTDPRGTKGFSQKTMLIATGMVSR